MIDFNQFINENLNEAFKFTEEQVVDIANLIAAAISKLDKVSAEVHDLEFDKGRGAGFEISMDGEKYAGGSYSVRPNGDVVNDAIGNSAPNAVYTKIGDTDVKKVMKNIQQYESVVTEAKKFYTTKEIVKLAKTAGDWVPDAKFAIQDLAVAYGDKVPAKELDKVLANYDLEIEDLMESISQSNKKTANINKGDFTKQNVFTTKTDIGETYMNEGSKSIPNSIGINSNTVKKALKTLDDKGISYKPLNQTIDGFDVYDLGSPGNVILALSVLQKRGIKVLDTERLDEGRKVTLKRRYTENHPAITAGKHARIRNKMLEAIKDGQITQEEFDNILKELSSDSKRWMRTNSKYFNVSEEGISLSKFGQKILKSITVNEGANENTNEGLNYKKLAKQFVNDEWLDEDDDIKDADEYFDDKLNAFNREELGNSEEFDNNKTYMSIEVKKLLKGRLKQIFEATTKNPEVWVPGAFDKELSKMPNSKITYDVVKDLAKKHKVFLDDAIAYVEYGWDLDLQENKNNKNNQMKSNFIYESFSSFVENELNEAKFNKKSLMKALKGDDGIILVNGQEYIIYNPNNNNDDNAAMWGNDTIIALDQDGEEHEFKYSDIERFSESVFIETKLNEAFKSSKLASLFRDTRGQIDKNLAQAFYRMSKIKMDQVEDHDIIEMDPKTAYKDKRESAVYFYFTRNEKENPYATSEYAGDRRIPANTLLAITNGKNEFYGVNWNRYGVKAYVMNLGSVGDSAGIGKSHSKYGGTGLSNVKRISDVADVAYVIDLNILRNRYDVSALKDTRSAAKAGAIAFKTDKEFKQENLNRYNTIIANRAAAMPIDKMVADAIDTLSAQIKDALAKGEKTRYNEILLGRTPKGREAKISDAANHMQRILDDFQRYVSYTNQAEEEKKAGYGGDYYTREVKNYAKRITDRIKQIETFSYAW